MRSNMKFFLSVFLTLCVIRTTLALNAVNSQKIKLQLKPKREAPLAGHNNYDGPSHRYLPPSPSFGNGYDSFRSHAANAAGVGYDFGSSGSASGNNRFAVGGGHHSGTKVETYIVQTENAPIGGSFDHSGHGNNDGFDAFGAQGQSNSYNYHTGSSGFVNSAASSFGGGYSAGHGANNGYSHASGPKVQTVIVPASTFGTGAVSGAGNGYNYAKSNGFSNSYHSVGADISNSAGFNSHFGGPASGIGNRFGNSGGHGGLGGRESSGYHYAPGISGNLPSHGGSFDLSGSHHTSSFGGNSGYSGAGGFASSHTAVSIPSTNYGVPTAAVSLGHSNKYHGSADSTPAYALGHKGLGHFSQSGVSAQTLNTDIIGSTKYSVPQRHKGHGYSNGFRSVPFTPSTFLGSIHEGSASSGYSSLGAEYGAPANRAGPIATPAAQYLPPLSPGFEYPQPTGSGASIHEPDSSYVPPNGAAQPSSSYLPPSGSYHKR